jgi:hypothetical protein
VIGKNTNYKKIWQSLTLLNGHYEFYIVLESRQPPDIYRTVLTLLRYLFGISSKCAAGRRSPGEDIPAKEGTISEARSKECRSQSKDFRRLVEETPKRSRRNSEEKAIKLRRNSETVRVLSRTCLPAE